MCCGQGGSCVFAPSSRRFSRGMAVFPLPALEQHGEAIYQRCVRIQSPGLSASPPVIARLHGA